jgi:DNA-binding transcriptional LysR family regulator
VGRTYFDYCSRIVTEVEDAERAVSSLQDVPRGVLRVTTGPNVAFLGPIISDYLKRYSQVRLELFSTTRAVDLVEERFDLGIRAGSLADSSLVAKRLGRVEWFFAATPAYLKKRGRPRTPTDLAKHDCLFFGTGLDGIGPRLDRDGETVQVTVAARMTVGDFDVLHAVATAGLGIAFLPAYQCLADLRVRRLERVLRDWNAPSTPIQVVYPTTRHLSPKVKSFVEHLEERMNPPPWELGPLP